MPTLAELAKKGQLHRIAQYLRQELTPLDFERTPEALEGRIEQLLHEALELAEPIKENSQIPNDKSQINSKPQNLNNQKSDTQHLTPGTSPDRLPPMPPASMLSKPEIPKPKSETPLRQGFEGQANPNHQKPNTTQEKSQIPNDKSQINFKTQAPNEQTPNTQHLKPVTPPAMHGEGASFRWVAESLASDGHPDRNEDAWLALPDASVAAVLDGVGGSAAAAAASQWVAAELKQSLRSNTPVTLADTLTEIGTKFISEAKTNKLLTGGTTTAAIARITGTGPMHKLEFAIIGDSRISIWRPTRNRYELTALDDQLLRLLLAPVERRPAWLKPLLAKHNLPADIKIEAAEAARLATILDQDPEPSRHDAVAKFLFDERAIVTQVIGAPALTPHSRSVDIEPGDRVLLATDGIHDNLTESELIGILSRTKFEDVASALVVRANEIAKSSAPRAKKDDMTAVVLEVR